MSIFNIFKSKNSNSNSNSSKRAQIEARMADIYERAAALHAWMNSGHATPAEYRRDERILNALVAEYDALTASLSESEA